MNKHVRSYLIDAQTLIEGLESTDGSPENDELDVLWTLIEAKRIEVLILVEEWETLRSYLYDKIDNRQRAEAILHGIGQFIKVSSKDRDKNLTLLNIARIAKADAQDVTSIEEVVIQHSSAFRDASVMVMDSVTSIAAIWLMKIVTSLQSENGAYRAEDINAFLKPVSHAQPYFKRVFGQHLMSQGRTSEAISPVQSDHAADYVQTIARDRITANPQSHSQLLLSVFDHWRHAANSPHMLEQGDQEGSHIAMSPAASIPETPSASRSEERIPAPVGSSSTGSSDDAAILPVNASDEAESSQAEATDELLVNTTDISQSSLAITAEVPASATTHAGSFSAQNPTTATELESSYGKIGILLHPYTDRAFHYTDRAFHSFEAFDEFASNNQPSISEPLVPEGLAPPDEDGLLPAPAPDEFSPSFLLVIELLEADTSESAIAVLDSITEGEWAGSSIAIAYELGLEADLTLTSNLLPSLPVDDAINSFDDGSLIDISGDTPQVVVVDEVLADSGGESVVSPMAEDELLMGGISLNAPLEQPNDAVAGLDDGVGGTLFDGLTTLLIGTYTPNQDIMNLLASAQGVYPPLQITDSNQIAVELAAVSQGQALAI